MCEPIQDHSAASLQLLETLVNLDSGTGDAAGLAQAAAVLEGRFKALHFHWETIAAADGSLHYCAQKGRGKRILLLAHLDTVFTKGTVQSRPFQIDGELARGPGVSDCKSGAVTIAGALEAVCQDVYSDYQICTLFNSDEEIGSPGSRPLIENLAAEAVAVLVAEPAEGANITVSRKGIGRFKLQVYGKAAHSGANYQEGCNAILEMAHKVIAIQDCTNLAEGMTLNVGVIEGGQRPNIVPDYAAAEIDLRICRAEQEVKAIADLRRIAAASRIPGVHGRLAGGITRPPMPETMQNRRLFESYQKTAAEMGIELGAYHSGGGSDANFTAALGIPTIDGVGPEGGGHHAAAEYLRIPSLYQRIGLLAAFLNSKVL